MFARKSVLVKPKPFIRDKQLFQLINCSKCTNTCPQPWPPLINGLIHDALLELSNSLTIWGFNFCLDNISYFVANLLRTLHVNFYQNRLRILEVMTKNVFVCSMPHSVASQAWHILLLVGWLSITWNLQSSRFRARSTSSGACRYRVAPGSHTMPRLNSHWPFDVLITNFNNVDIWKLRMHVI